MKTHRVLLSLAFFSLFLCLPLLPLEIKLGSLAPGGSPWDTALRRVAAEWLSESKGQITIKVYSGGIAGDEADMIRKMRINQLQAAAITGLGLNQIALDVLTIQLPFLVRTDEELDYTLEKMGPDYNQMIEAKGFKVLLWSSAGWAKFFSKDPIIYPEDLKPQRLFVMEGHADIDQAWKELGYRVIPINPNNALTALQSGMVDAFTATPLLAAAMQWFALAPHMCDLNFAPLIGGLIINASTWKRIPADLQPRLMSSLHRVEKQMRQETIELEGKAIEVMVKNGLQIHRLTPQAVRAWEDFVFGNFDLVAGKAFSMEVYEKTKAYVEEYRRSNAR